MKKHLALTVLILIVLSIMVSCGEDPFFHTVTIKNEGKTLGTEIVRDGSKYALPKEYKGIENLQGWKIGDDETVCDPGQEITVTKDITINAYTVLPYFDYEYMEGYGWMVTLKDEYLETVTDLVIPSSHEDKPVVYLQGFDKAVNLTSVTIPSTVQYIYFAFNDCPKLEKITFEEDSQVDAIMGFSNCTSLKSIVIPKSVTVLGDGCFYNCTGLESVTFEEGSKLTAIGKDDCFGNSKVTSVTFPEGLESIGGGCFSNCSNLTSISIPNSVYEISSRAFSKINENAKITIDRVKDSILNDKADKWEFSKKDSVIWTGKKTTYVIHYSTTYGQTAGEDFDSEICDFGNKMTIAECPSSWTKTGYTFTGWHTRSDYSSTHGRAYAVGETFTGPTITLYPVWKENSVT